MTTELHLSNPKKNIIKQNKTDLHSFFFSIFIRFQPFSILGDAEDPSPQVELSYMELRPTEIQQTSEYGSLMKKPEGDDDAKTEQDYVNAAFHRENEVYQNI